MQAPGQPPHGKMGTHQHPDPALLLPLVCAWGTRPRKAHLHNPAQIITLTAALEGDERSSVDTAMVVTCKWPVPRLPVGANVSAKHEAMRHTA